MKPWKFIERHDNELISLASRSLDILAFILGGYIAFVARDWPVQVNESLYYIANITGVLLVIIVFNLGGVYLPSRGQSWFDHFQKITLAWMSVFLILITIAFITKTTVNYSRIWIVSWAILSLVFLVVFRLILLKIINISRRNGWNRKKIVIVGANELGKAVLDKINNASWVGMDVVAFIDDDKSIQKQYINNVQVVGQFSDIALLVEEIKPDEVWITIPMKEEEQLESILHDLRNVTVNIRYVPNIFSYRLLNHSVSVAAGFPVINLTESPLYGVNQFVKFLEDKFLAFIILLFASPVMLLIALLVKLSSKGPVFYKQERVSWNGRSFTMWKFRSMPLDAETSTGPVWSKTNEVRATKIGGFLRKTSLDELPQFINVLLGDMSIVGPRPERPFFVEKFKDEIPSYMQKHIVRAGITGWAQVNGLRGDTDLKKRIEYDIYYIENWSLWFDLKIILITTYRQVLMPIFNKT
jgi:putative colanic acid biosynthesis UDP-glucose lipid carrier transferase